MSTFWTVLSALILLAFLAMSAPRIIALNRGRTLRNVALWVAIFLGLAVAYRTMGPGRTENGPLLGITSPSSDSPAATSDDLPARARQGNSPTSTEE